MRVIVPMKQVDTVRLKAALIAAGIPAWDGPMPEPGYAGPLVDGEKPPVDQQRMAVLVPDGSDPDIVARVVEAHRDDRTPAQIKRRQARQLIEFDDSPNSIRLRAMIRVLYGSLVETRTWCNQMRQQLQAAGMLTPPRLQNRTWEEAMQAVLNQIDAEIPE